MSNKKWEDEHYHIRTMRCPDCKNPLHSQFWCSICGKEIDQNTGKTTHHSEFPLVHPKRPGKTDVTP